jgi:hypothetical protein
MTDKTKTDSPYTRNAKGTWDLVIPAGREIEWGHTFDAERGYRVFLSFKDSYGKNTMSADAARSCADSIGDETADNVHLASKIRLMADQVDGLNRGWVAAGKPVNGLDELKGGRHEARQINPGP